VITALVLCVWPRVSGERRDAGQRSPLAQHGEGARVPLAERVRVRVEATRFHARKLLRSFSAGGATNAPRDIAVLWVALLAVYALEGLRLELTRLPESIIRRGAWADGEGGESPDAVFGHFRWRLLGDLDAAIGLPRTGAGTLAFQLESEGR